MKFEGLGRGYTGVTILMVSWCLEDLWGELLPKCLADFNEFGDAVLKLSADVHHMVFLCAICNSLQVFPIGHALAGLGWEG